MFKFVVIVVILLVNNAFVQCAKKSKIEADSTAEGSKKKGWLKLKNIRHEHLHL